MIRLVLLTMVSIFMATPAFAQPVVNAPAGSVRGEALEGINVFRGLPYAQPPVGRLRWRPTVELRPWRGMRDATQFGPVCPQMGGRPGSIYFEAMPAMSEDCLSLNIWVRPMPAMPRSSSGSTAAR